MDNPQNSRTGPSQPEPIPPPKNLQDWLSRHSKTIWGAAGILIILMVIISTILVLYNNYTNNARYEFLSSDLDAARTELENAQTEGSSIVLTLLRCRGIDESTLTKNDANLLDYYPTQMAATRQTPIAFTSSDLSILYLNKSIKERRVDLAVSSSKFYSQLSIWRVITTLIGAITTILVSVKSGFNDGKGFSRNILFVVGVFAIIFSAAGTAATALSSFYGPQEAYNNSVRSLSDMRQLHSQIATAVTQQYPSSYCGSSADSKKATEFDSLIKQWAAQYAGSLGGVGSSNASDKGNGGNGNGTQGSGQPKTGG